MSHKDPESERVVLPHQKTVDHLQKQINELKSLVLGQIDTDKLLLRALMDLDLIDYPSLKKALEHLREKYSEHGPAEEMFLGMITSFETSHGPLEQQDSSPQLRLVRPMPPDHDD